MIELPDLESLRCFVLAAQHANFRTAARKAALSPAAFGARIRRLEEQLGQRLFQRTTRRVELSARGAELLPHARSCIEYAVRCASPLARDEPAPFDLVLGSRFDVGLRWVVPAFAALERARPERRLHTTFGDVEQLVPRIFRDEVHCVLTTARLGDPNLVSTPFRQIEYVLVGTPELVAHNPLARPEDAARHVLLDFDDDLPLFRFFREARPPRETWAWKRHQYLTLVAAVRARVLEGAGVAVLPVFLVADDIKKRRLKVLMGETELKSNLLRAVWRRGHPYEAEIRALAAELAERAAAS